MKSQTMTRLPKKNLEALLPESDTETATEYIGTSVSQTQGIVMVDFVELHKCSKSFPDWYRNQRRKTWMKIGIMSNFITQIWILSTTKVLCLCQWQVIQPLACSSSITLWKTLHLDPNRSWRLTSSCTSNFFAWTCYMINWEVSPCVCTAMLRGCEVQVISVGGWVETTVRSLVGTWSSMTMTYQMTWAIESLITSLRKCLTLEMTFATFTCDFIYLPARIFNPMKSHKYMVEGSMTCCAVTGFSYKFKLYQRARVTAGNISDRSSEVMTPVPHCNM